MTINLDSKQGFITLQAAFPEAMLSAQVADQARELLQKYITRFKIEKASDKTVIHRTTLRGKEKRIRKSSDPACIFQRPK